MKRFCFTSRLLRCRFGDPLPGLSVSICSKGSVMTNYPVLHSLFSLYLSPFLGVQCTSLIQMMRVLKGKKLRIYCAKKWMFEFSVLLSLTFCFISLLCLALCVVVCSSVVDNQTEFFFFAFHFSLVCKQIHCACNFNQITPLSFFSAGD